MWERTRSRDKVSYCEALDSFSLNFWLWGNFVCGDGQGLLISGSIAPGLSF